MAGRAKTRAVAEKGKGWRWAAFRGRTLPGTCPDGEKGVGGAREGWRWADLNRAAEADPNRSAEADPFDRPKACWAVATSLAAFVRRSAVEIARSGLSDFGP